MTIRQLPPLLVNQIAAGEVIERPASVVKELVENAIDAGACRIEVRIEGGGRDLVQVIDDGAGIASEELILAIAPHATSKIRESEDLDAIATMGFRGEALASIASVSRLSILSRPRSQDEAWLIEIEGEQVKPARPAGGAPGTTVTMRTLFFNTPARRKFLRTEQTESGRVLQVMQAIAMAHPSIAFALRTNDRLTLDLPPNQTARQRVVQIIGAELEEELLEVEADEHALRLWGLAGLPEIARGTSKHQRLYLNGRPITDRSVMHAIKEAYRGLIEPSRYPTVVLFLEMDPSQVDVNVHPAKAEVRFRNQGQVHRLVHSALRAALRGADLTPAFDLDRSGAAPTLHRDFGSGMPSSAPSPEGDRALVEYLRQMDPRQKGFVYTEVKQALEREAPELLDPPTPTSVGTIEPAPETTLPEVRPVTDAMQVHSSYIVTQDEQGLLIIDQHALHERVMFEKLRNQVGRGPLESQRLLMPATITVDRQQTELVEPLQPLFSRIGIEAELMGPESVAIHAFPSLLFSRNVEPASFMEELLDRAHREGLPEDPEAALHETLDMMACKAAVKAGDRLTPQEISELIAYRESVERSSNCPHGRPTSLRLTMRDLDRQFGRG